MSTLTSVERLERAEGSANKHYCAKSCCAGAVHDMIAAAIAKHARTLQAAPSVALVDCGCGNGLWLDNARQAMHAKACTAKLRYIGIEGGQAVGAPAYVLRHAQQKGFILGVSQNVTFEALSKDEHKNHPLWAAKHGDLTVAHVYDGGVLLKRAVAALIATFDRVKGAMLVTFVTSRHSNYTEDDKCADWRFIKRRMKIAKFALKRSIMQIHESHNHKDQPDMHALWFTRLAT